MYKLFAAPFVVLLSLIGGPTQLDLPLSPPNGGFRQLPALSRPDLPSGPGERPIHTLASFLQQAEVHIKAPPFSGTGFLFEGHGGQLYVWTAGHVVDHLRSQKDGTFPLVEVILHNGAELMAEVVRCDLTADLAVLRLPHAGLNATSLTFEQRRQPQLGEQVFSVGGPFGSQCRGSFSIGNVSYVGRPTQWGTFLQINMVTIGGQSGSAIVNRSGHVVGVLTRGGGNVMALAVPGPAITDWATRNGIRYTVDPSVVPE